MEATINKIEINAEIVHPEIKVGLNVVGTIGGETRVLEVVSGMPIIGGHAVAIVNGKLFHADITNPEHCGRVLGIAKNSGNENEIIEVVQSGEFYYPGLELTVNNCYQFDNLGRLTDKVTQNSAYFQFVGIAKDRDTLIVNINDPIWRLN